MRNLNQHVCAAVLPGRARITVVRVPARGQGCIVARSSSLDMSPESQGGYLDAGDWDITVGYRHQFSYKHFVGYVEQTYRVQQGTAGDE